MKFTNISESFVWEYNIFSEILIHNYSLRFFFYSYNDQNLNISNSNCVLDDIFLFIFNVFDFFNDYFMKAIWFSI
jgi:hypothetical protein